LEQAQQLMQQVVLFSVSASTLMVVIGFSIQTARTWFTAQAQTAPRGVQLQLSEHARMEFTLAFGLTEHTYIMLIVLKRGVDYIIAGAHLIVMAQLHGQQLRIPY
jgi:hypothetical protein